MQKICQWFPSVNGRDLLNVKQETYKVARERLLTELAALGWVTKPQLKRPQAINPEGVQLFFNAQSVHRGTLSLWIDIRGMSVEKFIASI